VNCTKKCVWPRGSTRTRWGAISLPRPLSRYKGKGREKRGRKGLGVGRGKWGREGCEGVGRDGENKGETGREREGWEWEKMDGKDREGKREGGSGRGDRVGKVERDIGYLSRGSEFLVTPLGMGKEAGLLIRGGRKGRGLLLRGTEGREGG